MEDKDKKELLEREGVKYDGGKLRYDLIPADALEQLAAIYTMGAKKYTDNNWRKGMSWSRPFSALMRHAWAWFRGEDIDPESGLNHLAHAAWNCFTLINYSKSHPEFDNRIKNDGKHIDKDGELPDENEVRIVDVYFENGDYYGRWAIDPNNIDMDIVNGIGKGELYIKPVKDGESSDCYDFGEIKKLLTQIKDLLEGYE